MPWTYQEFISKASGLSHPGHFLDGVHPTLKDHLVKLSQVAAMARERTLAMRKWIMRAQELKAHVKGVLGKKNFKFLAEMLGDAKSPDEPPAAQMAKGFALMGKIPAGGVFADTITYATLLPS